MKFHVTGTFDPTLDMTTRQQEAIAELFSHTEKVIRNDPDYARPYVTSPNTAQYHTDMSNSEFWQLVENDWIRPSPMRQSENYQLSPQATQALDTFASVLQHVQRLPEIVD